MKRNLLGPVLSSSHTIGQTRIVVTRFTHLTDTARVPRRTMASVREDNIPHVVRTAADQRQKDMYSATIGRIEQVNSTIRLLRLYLDNDQVGESQTEASAKSPALRVHLR